MNDNSELKGCILLQMMAKVGKIPRRGKSINLVSSDYWVIPSDYISELVIY